MCGADFNAMRNLEKCAKSQGQLEWLESVKSDAKKVRAAVQAYHVRCSPEVTGLSRNKRNGFVVAQYISEVRQAEQLLVDGVYEMLNIVAYEKFKGLPENGGLDAEEARAQFHNLVKDPSNISDLLGPTPKLARRVAVKVKDVITVRDLQEKARIIRGQDKDIKNPSQENIDKLHDRLQRGDGLQASAGTGRWEEARNLMTVTPLV